MDDITAAITEAFEKTEGKKKDGYLKVKQNILNTKVKEHYMIKLISVGIAVLVCCYTRLQFLQPTIKATPHQSENT